MYDEVYNSRQGFVIPNEHIPSDDDMQRYAEKDESVVNQLVEGVTGYVVASVEWFISKTPSAKPYEEDCVSEALLAIQMFVTNSLGRKYTPSHFQSTVKVVALSKVKDWLREMSVAVTMPARTTRRNQTKLVRHGVRDDTRSTSKDPVFDQVWFDTFIGGLDDFDRQLVSLKMAGMSDREIGREIGIQHQHVSRHLTRLAQLFQGE
jgi:hypothetical protein